MQLGSGTAEGNSSRVWEAAIEDPWMACGFRCTPAPARVQAQAADPDLSSHILSRLVVTPPAPPLVVWPQVYDKSRAGRKFDPMQRGDRWKSDFIWNEDWQAALQMEESVQASGSVLGGSCSAMVAVSTVASRSENAAAQKPCTLTSAQLQAGEHSPHGHSPTLPPPPPAPTRAQRKYDAAQAAREAASADFGPGSVPSSSAGGVSFSRVSQLDDMSVDLTTELVRKQREANSPEAVQRRQQEQEVRPRDCN